MYLEVMEEVKFWVDFNDDDHENHEMTNLSLLTCGEQIVLLLEKLLEIDRYIKRVTFLAVRLKDSILSSHENLCILGEPPANQTKVLWRMYILVQLPSWLPVTPVDFSTTPTLNNRFRLTERTLEHLQSRYNLSKSCGSSGDVLHRWCELVVKHRYEPGLECLEWFLAEHQAMGIYLYGELAIVAAADEENTIKKRKRRKIVKSRSKFSSLGRAVFKRLEAEMDVELAKSVREMTFGS